MRHLVTGGSGFVGSLIARRLAARGDRVRVLDLWDDPARPPAIEYVAGDVLDREAVSRALAGVDLVHHNAALVPLTKAGARFRDVNVEGSRIVAEEAVRAGIGSFVHMSSSAIFGAPERCPVPDDAPARPIEAYGRSKLDGELAVRRAVSESRTALYVVRPRTVLGDGRLGIFQILFQWIRDGRPIYVIGTGRQKIQFVHADDLLDGYLAALDAGKPGTYNIGTDRFGSLEEMLQRLIAFAKSSSRIRRLPAGPAIAALRLLDGLGLSPLAPWHYLTYHKDFYFDVEPLKRLGWSPKYSNDEMLLRSYEWFLAHPSDGPGGSPHRGAVRERFLRLVKGLP